MINRRYLVILGLFLAPSLAFADRLGSLKSNADVLLTTQAVSSGGGLSVAIQDEGSYIATVGTINFVGAGVSTALTGTSSVTVTINGGSGGAMTSGSTMYINNVSLVSGTTAFSVSSGTINGPLEVYPNADSGNYIKLTTINTTEPTILQKTASGADSAHWRMFDDADVLRFWMKGMGTNGGWSFSASTVTTLSAIERLRFSDQNDGMKVAINSGNQGVDFRKSTTTFDGPGSRDPMIDYATDGVFKVRSSTIDLRNATVFISSVVWPGGSIQISSPTSGGTGISSIDISTNSFLVAASTSINIIPGTNVTVSGINSGGRTDITINASGSGGGSQIYNATSTVGVPALVITSSTVFKLDTYGAGSFNAFSSSGCGGLVTITTGASNNVDITGRPFQSGTTQYAWIKVPLPENYIAGSTFTANIVWTSSASSGNVVWNVELRSVANGESYDSAYGTTVSITNAAAVGYALKETGWMSSITAAGTPSGGEFLFIRLWRGVSASDTLTANALFTELQLSYPISNLSARNP